MRGIYIHIPFCKRKCPYCAFYSVEWAPALWDAYLKALLLEIHQRGDKRGADTLYIGGGTPSIIPPQDIARILSEVQKAFCPSPREITIEANPESVSLPKAREWKAMGINRISLGVQTWKEEELKQLGRIHTTEDSKRAISTLRSVGFYNISVDLIWAKPHDTSKHWEENLTETVNLEIPHISAYAFTPEDKTPLGEAVNRGELELPSDEDIGHFIEITLCKLAGYIHYEVSNFAKPEFECIHNILYWAREEYIGLGASACGYIKNKELRYQNAPSIESYINGEDEIREHLSPEEILEEKIMLGLRTNRGINVQLVRHKKTIIEEMVEGKYANIEEERFVPTSRGMYVADFWTCKFLS